MGTNSREHRAKRFALVRKLVFLILLGSIPPLFAQSFQLTEEIENLEKLTRIPEQKREAYIQLAQLHHLSGNREKALESWIAASYADPDKRDIEALLEAVKLWISMGDYDKAGAELKAVLLSNCEQKILESALYLSAQLNAFKKGDGDDLKQLVNIPLYKDLQSRMFYTLWKITQDSSWRTRLLNAYPKSPEAEISEGKAGIAAAVTPQWLFFPLREDLASTPALASIVPAFQDAVLQTGLFSREENARTMADRLIKAGFWPEITCRTVNGNEYWTVMVSAGSDVNQTIRELKNAGFESFPVN